MTSLLRTAQVPGRCRRTWKRTGGFSLLPGSLLFGGKPVSCPQSWTRRRPR